MTLFLQVIFFGAVGVTAEVFYTATKRALVSSRQGKKGVLTLQGESYIRMFLIYGLIPVIAPYVIDLVGNQYLLVRLSLYAIVILAIEYLVGGLLRIVLGKVPWKYTKGLHIHGLIRLDYFPLWMLFAWAVEVLYLIQV